MVPAYLPAVKYNGGMDAPPPTTSGTREKILDAALELFTSKGYDKASLREVAEMVGVTKAALYYHFPSKENLLSALVEGVHSAGRHGLDLMPPVGGYSDGAEMARVALVALDTMLAQRRIFLLMERNRTAMGNLREADPQHDQLHQQMEARWAGFIGNQAVPLRDRVRFAAAAGALFSGVIGTTKSMGVESQPGFRREIALALFDLLEIKPEDRPSLEA